MLKFQKILIIASSFVLTTNACASSHQKLAADEQFTITIDRTQKSKIKSAELRVDDDEIFIRGLVSRGNNSHVPKYFMGHIDFITSSSEGDYLHSGIVKLGGRQTRYFYKVPQGTPQGSSINLVYSKWSHATHLKKSTMPM